MIRRNVQTLKGFDPKPMVGLGTTDMRLWRDRGIPAYVYGPSPRTMGARDERVEIEEFQLCSITDPKLLQRTA